MLWNYLAVMAGGAIGCCARFGLTQVIQSFYQGRSFPLATLVVNVAGSLLLGFVYFAALERLSINPVLRLAIIAGGLGGFTTFSTFTVESLVLVESGTPGRALLYLTLSVVLGVFAAFVGGFLARAL
ncbi:MAG: fluoride efflux transporter CrcB [Gammaproteobacteria bacterium]|nr:fluoride efflux transporter CrcB [Gammaproteobacteria bacterium]